MKKDKSITHIQVNTEDKEKLEKIKADGGYASIRVVLSKLLAKYGDKPI